MDRHYGLSIVGAMLLLMTASALLASIEHPNGLVVVAFLADLIVGIALLVYAFTD